MPIRLIVTTTAEKGKGEEHAKRVASNLANVRKEPGCEQYSLFRDVEDSDRFVMVERWKDKAALDTHLNLIRTRRQQQPAPTANAPRGVRPTIEMYPEINIVTFGL
ncbi:MAG: antibiotic biosynthesis monooxygenase [Dehalococcoidia bacterium]|nr:antibiotic biosynthesis monooxygenase [Dehalococcoidia bacterium]